MPILRNPMPMPRNLKKLIDNAQKYKKTQCKLTHAKKNN